MLLLRSSDHDDNYDNGVCCGNDWQSGVEDTDTHGMPWAWVLALVRHGKGHRVSGIGYISSGKTSKKMKMIDTFGAWSGQCRVPGFGGSAFEDLGLWGSELKTLDIGIGAHNFV